MQLATEPIVLPDNTLVDLHEEDIKLKQPIMSLA